MAKQNIPVNPFLTYVSTLAAFKRPLLISRSRKTGTMVTLNSELALTAFRQLGSGCFSLFAHPNLNLNFVLAHNVFLSDVHYLC